MSSLIPLLLLLHASAALYLFFLILDSTHRLLTKTTDLAGLVRYRNPGLPFLLAAVGLYALLNNCSIPATGFQGYALEGTKLLVIAEALGWGWRRLGRRWWGGRKLVAGGRGVGINKGTSEVGEEVRRLREERVGKLEEEARTRRREKRRVMVAEEEEEEDLGGGKRLGGAPAGEVPGSGGWSWNWPGRRE